MRKGIAIAGNIILDNIKIIDKYPQQGMLSSILSEVRTSGGAVPNIGIDLKLMDHTQIVRAVGLIGEDENGGFVLNRMNSVGVDISSIKVISNVATSYTDVMTAQSTGERTFFHSRGANSLFSLEHINFEALRDCSIFHLAYALLLDAMDKSDFEYGTVMAKTLSAALANGLITSMDVVSEDSERFAEIVIPSLKYCNYLIINEVEASRICNIPVRSPEGIVLGENISLTLKALMDKGVINLVIIHAPEGSWCMNRRYEIIFRPALELQSNKIQGTVGAGDAFCAGVLYALNKGLRIEKALDIGAGAAACIITDQSGFSMKSIEDIDEMLSELPRKK